MMFVQNASIIWMRSVGQLACFIAVSIRMAPTWNCSMVRSWSSTIPFASLELVAGMAVVVPSEFVTNVSASLSIAAKDLAFLRPALV